MRVCTRATAWLLKMMLSSCPEYLTESMARLERKYDPLMSLITKECNNKNTYKEIMEEAQVALDDLSNTMEMAKARASCT